MTTNLGPARRLELARTLGKLREQAQLTQRELAERAGVSKQTVSRYETWRDRAGVNTRTVKALAEAAGAPTDVIAALVGLTRNSGEDGWWTTHKGLSAGLGQLIEFERWAQYEHIYANNLVPGLLQTHAYNVATHQAQEVRRTPKEIEDQVEARARRQEILTEPAGIDLWAVLDEAVLRRVVGNRGLMAEQMAHLLTLSELPNVEIQVMPFSSGATAAGVGHFLLLGRPHDVGVVYIELRQAGLYLDEVEEVATYMRSWDYVRSQAASLSESRDLVYLTRQEYQQ